MRVMHRAIAAMCAMSLCESHVDASPRQPTGNWRVDYDTAQCLAMRDYGTSAKPLELIFKPSPNNGVMRILVVRHGSPTTDQMPATLKLGSLLKHTNLLVYSDDKNQFRIVSINVPMNEFKAQLDARYLNIVGAGFEDTFALSQLPGVAAELDKCVLDLQRYWNIGEPNKGGVAKPAEPKQPLNRLFSAADYPGVAISQLQQGIVTMTFLVDEQGNIADCTVDETSGIAALDTMSCYVITKRAHFQPALGPDGKPMKSAHTTKVRWRIAG